MILHLLLQAHHYDEGNLRSAWNDPICVAIREKFNLDPFKHEHVYVSNREVYFSHDGKAYSAIFDVEKFHKTWNKIPRVLVLKMEVLWQKFTKRA